MFCFSRDSIFFKTNIFELMLFLFSSLCETSEDGSLLGKVISGNEGEIAVPLSLSTYIHVQKEST